MEWLEAFDSVGAPPATFAPATLKQALDGALELGRAAGRLPQAMRVLADAELRLGALSARMGVQRRSGTVAGAPAPRVAVLRSMHSLGAVLTGGWAPDLVALAGGHAVLTRSGGPNVEATPADLAAARVEVVVFALDATTLADAVATHRQVWSGNPWRALDGVRIAALDGLRFVNVPGPALVRSAELIAAAVHGQAAGVTTSHDELARCEPILAGNAAPGA